MTQFLNHQASSTNSHSPPCNIRLRELQITSHRLHLLNQPLKTRTATILREKKEQDRTA
uniref:Uncharacterized protein n=1 Tax=Rhizophora mucronata TaxID=61149 RepID=A0A2P2R1V1_RHIMU